MGSSGIHQRTETPTKSTNTVKSGKNNEFIQQEQCLVPCLIRTQLSNHFSAFRAVFSNKQIKFISKYCEISYYFRGGSIRFKSLEESAQIISELDISILSLLSIQLYQVYLAETPTMYLNRCSRSSFRNKHGDSREAKYSEVLFDNSLSFCHTVVILVLCLDKLNKKIC